MRILYALAAAVLCLLLLVSCADRAEIPDGKDSMAASSGDASGQPLDEPQPISAVNGISLWEATSSGT